MWRPQDIVAIILTVGVVSFLASQTPISMLWLTPEELNLLRETETELRSQFWKDVMNVILGALAGYIAGRSKHD